MEVINGRSRIALVVCRNFSWIGKYQIQQIKKKMMTKRKVVFDMITWHDVNDFCILSENLSRFYSLSLYNDKRVVHIIQNLDKNRPKKIGLYKIKVKKDGGKRRKYSS